MAEETTTETPTTETPTTDSVKPGYKTTEFWLSVAACALGAFAASGALPDENVVMKIVGLGVSALAAMGYTVSRFLVKNGAK